MTIQTRVKAIQKEIEQAEQAAHREPHSVKLLAVSKTQPVEAIKAAFHAGIHDFGENYVNEALPKINALKHLPITWHFIGSIQSNKTHLIAEHFDWVHSLDRAKIAQKLNLARSQSKPPIQVCIQVNLNQEKTKSGVLVEELEPLCAEILRLPQLQLRGLMIIPEPSPNPEEQFQTFSQLKRLGSALNLNLDTLSMGMSNDYLVAIRAGSTLLRLGRAIFGKRLKTPLTEVL